MMDDGFSRSVLLSLICWQARPRMTYLELAIFTYAPTFETLVLSVLIVLAYVSLQICIARVRKCLVK